MPRLISQGIILLARASTNCHTYFNRHLVESQTINSRQTQDIQSRVKKAYIRTHTQLSTVHQEIAWATTRRV